MNRSRDAMRVWKAPAAVPILLLLCLFVCVVSLFARRASRKASIAIRNPFNHKFGSPYQR